MNTAWLDRVFDVTASVVRRSTIDVHENATQQEFLDYVSRRVDGPWTVLETHHYYILIRGDAAPPITVHMGNPTLH